MNMQGPAQGRRSAARVRLRRAAKIGGWTAATVLAVPILYFLAALLLGLVPVNAGWRQPRDGIPIFVQTNGVHTWIVVPKVTAHMDWRRFAPGAHLRDPRWGAADYLGFGYGNRTVYLETPTWADLRMKDAVFATIGSGSSLVHAVHEQAPKAAADTRPIILSHDQYGRLVAYILASFRYDPQGRPIPLLGRGYGPNDMFYEGEGPYHAVLTCNEWTGRALRAAGVRMGAWTPLSQSIMWRLDASGGGG